MKHVSALSPKNLIIALIGSVLLPGCVTYVTKGNRFPEFYNQMPNVVLVLPPINLTTDVEAKELYVTTISEPLAENGYYAIPAKISTDILRANGMYDTEMIFDQPAGRFGELFGADAVLYTRIHEWDKRYAILAANLTIRVDAELRSTHTNEVIWDYEGVVVADLTVQGNASAGLAGLIVQAIATSVNTAIAKEIPYARLATTMMLESMPKGKYHSAFGQDQKVAIVENRPKIEAAKPTPATTK